MNFSRIITIRARQVKNMRFFLDVIRSAIISSTPRKFANPIKKLTGSSNPVPWWDHECEKLKRLRRASYKKWQFSNNTDDLLEHKKAVTLFRKTIKEKKKTCFRKFASSINFNTNINYVWNKCKIFKNKWAKPTPTHSTENAQANDETDMALNKLSPAWAETNPHWLPPCQKNDFFDHLFDFNEFNMALESKNISSAPGQDGIDFEMLFKLPIKFKLILLDIFNEMFKNSDYPESWKHSFIHFIPKGDNKGVRPIALTSCICKLYETLIKSRLTWWAEHFSLIPKNQAGFRKGKSCADNLTMLTLKIEEAYLERKNVLAAFLDVQGAFDNINTDILLTKLAAIGCSEAVVRFIQFLTHERIIYTDSNTHEFRTVHKGVPQGGVLSPLLYILYVADVTSNLQKTMHSSQFADDLALYIKCRTVKRGKRILENAIKTVQLNLSNLGLELVPAKTNFIHFNKTKILPGSTELKIGDVQIKSIESARFLGIHFDYKMDFNIHTNSILKKCYKALNIVKFLCGTSWGSDPTTVLILYKSFVRSIVDYGSLIYFPTRKSLVDKIEKIQRVAIRTALGYRQTTPNNLILAESKLLLLQHRAKYLCNCFLTKSLSIKDSNTALAIKTFYHINKKSTVISNRIIKQSILEVIEKSKIIDTHNNLNIYSHDYKTVTTSIPINIDLGKMLKKSKSTDINALFNEYFQNTDDISIYTDGSKIKESNSVGAACVCPDLNINIKKSIISEASIYTAECIALSQAFDLAQEIQKKNVNIFSDSLSVLKTLSAPSFNVKNNAHIHNIKLQYNNFLKKNKHHKITLYWIPSHMGISGNECADALAKTATELAMHDVKSVHFTELYQNYKLSAWQETQNTIKNQATATGTKYFELFYKPDKKTWFHKKNLNRQLIVMINRIRSNHYNLAKSLNRVNILSDPLCKCEKANENINHVLWQCDQYENARKILLSSLAKLKFLPPYNIEMFVSEPNVPACRCILSFLQNCNIQL